MSIDAQKNIIRELDLSGKKELALVHVQELIEKHPDNASLWSLQASILKGMEHYIEAINSMNKAIDLKPEEASFYWLRGMCNFKVDNLSEAVIDFSHAIQGNNYGDVSFTQGVYFFRAEAFIKLGKKEKALSDISHIPEDHKIWTFKLRNKADLLEDCNKL